MMNDPTSETGLHTTGLTTAPLDTFESIPGWCANDPRHMATFSVALAHEIPILLLSRQEEQIAQHLADPALQAALDAGFRDFCIYAAPRWQGLRVLSEALVTDLLAARPVNSHPLLRVFRDHWFWLWYEMLITARALGAPAARAIVYWKEGPITIAGKLCRRPAPSPNALIGPTLVVQSDIEECDAEAALERFCTAIDAGWATIPDKDLPPSIKIRSGGRFPLYTTAFLLRVAAARPRASLRDLNEVCAVLDNHLTQLTEISEGSLQFGPYRSVFNACALITGGLNRGQGRPPRKYGLEIQQLSMDGPPRLVTATALVALRHEGPSVIPAQIDQSIDRQGRQITAAWRAYIHDANTLLSAWLNRSLWERVSQGAEEDRWGDLGRRLTRFLAATFMANESSFYRVDYTKCYRTDDTEARPGLVHLGGCSDDEAGGEKIATMAQFMARIPEEQQRKASICYRSLDANAIEYVPFEDPDRPRDDRQLAFFDSSRWSLRGRSAVALPIRVNGTVWGIVELISFSYDHFPFNVRAQLGEIVDTIGNMLSFHNVSWMLNYIDKITAKTGTEAQTKRKIIVDTFPSLFMSSDVALVKVSTGRSDEWESTLVASTGPHPLFASGTDLLGILRPRISALFRRGDPLFVAALSEEHDLPQRSAANPIKNTFALVALPAQGRRLPDVLVLRFPVPVFPEAGWHLPFQVLGQYVLNAIDTLDAEINWAHYRRARFGHEMIRHITAIGDVDSRMKAAIDKAAVDAETRMKAVIDAETRMKAAIDKAAVDAETRMKAVIDAASRMKAVIATMPQRQDGRYHEFTLPLSDLDRANRSLRLYAEALTDATLLTNSAEDPRVAAMRRHLEGRKSWTPRSIDVRETFNSASHSRFAEATIHGLQFELLQGFKYPKVRVDDILLYDVMNTLVDNAIKYALPKTKIFIRPHSADNLFSLAFTNLGAELIGDEADRIFQDRFRGQYARKRFPDEGRGLGLGYARALMELVGGDLTYRQKRISDHESKFDGFNVVWHHFILTFPGRLLYDR